MSRDDTGEFLLTDDGVRTRPEPPAAAHSGASASMPAPTMTDQVRVAWTEVLGHDDFDDDTPFLEAGGHSLKAAQVLIRLRRQLGVRLPNRLFFDHPTVRELAAAVERIATTSPLA
ncbi:acyl carrier protein [Streptomyces sp. NPDC029006]|uniref:acyl carrier protein n=1 Tax=Streptomyces sp. NPDC029006 TaxID=3155467 RepID=UPI0033E22376